MNSYKSLGFTTAQKVIANCDKLSAHSAGDTVFSPWGIFRMYHKSPLTGRRYYSLSGSEVFTNRGSLLIGTIKRMLLSFSK